MVHIHTHKHARTQQSKHTNSVMQTKCIIVNCMYVNLLEIYFQLLRHGKVLTYTEGFCVFEM